MERTTSEKIRLGIFVIVGSIVLLLVSYFIGQKQNMFGKNIDLFAEFQNVNGLQPGNNVRFSGVNVGTVKGIEMINDTSIIVHMIISENIQQHLRKNAVATIGSDGLVGSMLINISPGKGSSEMVNSGDMIRTYSRIATEEMMGTLSESNENIALLTKDLLQITEALNSGTGTLGKLLTDTSIAKNLALSISNLEFASSSLRSTMHDLRELTATFDSEGTVAHFLLKDSISGIQLAELFKNLDGAGKDIGSASEELDQLLGELRSSDGTLNLLMNDTTFRASLSRSMKNLETGSELLNEDLEALQHNFLTRKYFKKKKKKEKQ